MYLSNLNSLELYVLNNFTLDLKIAAEQFCSLVLLLWTQIRPISSHQSESQWDIKQTLHCTLCYSEFIHWKINMKSLKKKFLLIINYFTVNCLTLWLFCSSCFQMLHTLHKELEKKGQNVTSSLLYHYNEAINLRRSHSEVTRHFKAFADRVQNHTCCAECMCLSYDSTKCGSAMFYTHNLQHNTTSE